MDFFERIGRKITDAGQGVAQQTRNLTETTRLNGKIAENKKQMSQLLFEMGQDYYKKHRKETDNEEQEYIDRVNALFREIVKCQKEIERIKTADVCKVCGSRIVEGSSFCMSCGTRLDAEELEYIPSDSARRCPVCGTVADEDSAFCTACGTRLEDIDNAYVGAMMERETEETRYVPRICPICGSEAEEEDLFCLTCGSRL